MQNYTKAVKLAYLCYDMCMKIEFNTDELDYLRELEDITNSDADRHQAICGYIGGGKQTRYADIDLGEDFINALSVYAYKNNLTLQRALRLVIDDFVTEFIKDNNDNE